MRCEQQNELEAMKRFPKKNFPLSEGLNALSKGLEMNLIENIDRLQSLYCSYGSTTLLGQPDEHGEGKIGEGKSLREKIDEEVVSGKQFGSSRVDAAKIYEQFIS